MPDNTISRPENKSLIPIIVGVTGHRYIKSRNEPEIQKIFDELDNMYPNTPIVVLSPLADGADRLIAQVALRTRRKKKTPISLVCPLPLPQDLYMTDFDDGSKKEFVELLEKSEALFQLPLVTPGKSLRRGSRGRELQYEAVGKYIANHCHILIALWDETDALEKRGSTAQIVRIRHSGMEENQAGDPNDIYKSTIYHIPVRKKSNDQVEFHQRREIFSGVDLYNSEIYRKTSAQQRFRFHQFLSRLEIYNSEVKEIDEGTRQKIDENKDSVVPEAKFGNLTGISHRLLNHFVIADFLALKYKYSTGWAYRLLFINVLAGPLFFEVYAHLIRNLLVLAAYPIFFAVSFLLHHFMKSRKVVDKYVYFRSLAETLRIKVFLHSSIEHEIPYPYLGRKDEQSWFESAYRTVSAATSTARFLENVSFKQHEFGDERKGLKFVQEYWVENQASYFKAISDRYEKLQKVRLFYPNMFLILGFLLALILILIEISFGHDGLITEQAHAGFIVAIGTTGIMAAAMEEHFARTAITAVAKRSRWMSGLFSRAAKDLDEMITDDRIQDARLKIEELCTIAMTENAEWLNDSLEYEFEIPKG